MTELISSGECRQCGSWLKLSDQDGGIGICDSIRSDHGQHILGHTHPGCAAHYDKDEPVEATDETKSA